MASVRTEGFAKKHSKGIDANAPPGLFWRCRCVERLAERAHVFAALSDATRLRIVVSSIEERGDVW